MDFSLSIALDPPTATLVANGELDIFTAQEVSRRLGELITAGCTRVLVDLGGVTFADASALGVFARARAELVARQGSIGFLAASPPFRRVCRLTGLDTVFDLN
ncbi:STAS domain-containing protein [Nocardioides aquiterrae]|uniref:STAS domain-containing protein n=1 Tax=Nocardioides aquiterrae TaxID=203799 RepID=A0ABN1UP78_9ACTN